MKELKKSPKCTEGEHNWERPLELVGGMQQNPGVFKEYKGDLPALALRLVKAEPKRQSTPQPCSYDCGDCAQCRAYGQWADEQE